MKEDKMKKYYKIALKVKLPRKILKMTTKKMELKSRR
jgi:hypothetical protein